ncbi:MAG: DUF2652 domain-containing protein [Marinifilaceae bacterium]|jgi:hypothetical protein
MEQKGSFLFIPDISGFTNFVKDIEINHSQHIISELLELIIDANELDLTLAEIEGDAVFFYKYREIPSILDILNQVQKMYTNFHTHIKRYERDRICHCGACSQAVNLKLKIIAHAGQFNLVKVKEFQKPFGKDVITIHNLLKNDIREKEYLLLSKQLLQNLDTEYIRQPLEWPVLKAGHTEYEKIGRIQYEYANLSPLQQYISPPPPVPSEPLTRNPLIFQTQIRKPIEDIFELVSNFNYRLQWNKKVNQFDYEKDKMNRIGARHICVIGSQTLEFKTVSNDFGNNKLVYGETTSHIPLVKKASTYFILESIPQGTKLRIEVHYKPRPILGWLTTPMFKRFISKTMNDALLSIKKISEENKRI